MNYVPETGRSPGAKPKETSWTVKIEVRDPGDTLYYLKAYTLNAKSFHQAVNDALELAQDQGHETRGFSFAEWRD